MKVISFLIYAIGWIFILVSIHMFFGKGIAMPSVEFFILVLGSSFIYVSGILVGFGENKSG